MGQVGLPLAFQVSGKFNNDLTGLRFSYFRSQDKRDAIINQDGSFSSLIVLENRFGYGYTGNTSKIYENMIGTNLGNIS